MALSNSSDFGLITDSIIAEALELLGIYVTGGAVINTHKESCRRTLEMMVKAWGAEGIGLWKLVEAALFLEHEGYEYTIGPSGDHCTASWVKTEIATAASSGGSTITVDSDTGISDGDYIGVELDGGTLQWTTVNGAPSSEVVTLTDSLTDDVAVDNHVYTYTDKLQKPLRITEARIRIESEDDNDDCSETVLDIKHRNQYMAIADKEATGTARLIYYDPQLTYGNLRVYPACDDVQHFIKFTAKIPIMDFDDAANSPDLPQEWMLALSWNLAILVAAKFGKTVSPDFIAQALAFKRAVTLFDRERHPIGLSG